MARHLEDSDDWDEGCDSHGCNCHGGGCGGDDSGDWSDDGDDDLPTVPCPYCGQYISAEDAPPRRMPWWIILGVVLCLCAVVVWIVLF